MERLASSTGSDINQEFWISSDLFARYAETDLDRWRPLIGHQVKHKDPRWGIGTVESVFWGSPCDHVPAYVQVRICYEAGWTVSVHSATWRHHHLLVSVAAPICAAIRACLDPALSDEEQTECLARHTHKLREQYDREALDRAKRKQ